MKTGHALVILLATAIAAMPSAAAAQPDRDRARARTVIHAGAASVASTAVDLALKASAAYQRGEDRRQQTEQITKTVSIGRSGELDVSNLAGNITVKRGGGEQATIEATKIGYGRTDDEAREMLKLVQVQITERARRVEVRTNYGASEAFRGERVRGRRSINVTVNYNITAPAATRLVVKTLSGDVTVGDITGELALSSTSGHLRITNAERISSAATMSGDVEITNTRLEAPLEASSVSGSVIVRQTSAPSVDLGTVSGNVVLTGVECERIDAHSLSGDVIFESPLARNGRYEFNSHSGSVRLTISGNVGFEVEANSFSGTVTTNPPGILRMNTAGDPRAGGRRVRSISGVVGDGSAVLDITTFSGNVQITKR